MSNYVNLPLWLDKIIFDDFNGIYEKSPSEVNVNAEKGYKFAKIYLGTYFPRSFAEAYHIFGKLLDNSSYYQVLNKFDELRILDFCCGMGGEIIGLISILNSRLPNLKRVIVDAYDANPDYIRHLFKIKEYLQFGNNFEVFINPQCLFIENEQYLRDISNPSKRYNIVLSCKALNEFIQCGFFPNENIYRKIAEVFLPCLNDEGILLLSDLTHKNNEFNVYYPEIMNKGLNSLICSSNFYKTLYPYPCFFHENECNGCYMQDVIFVSHRNATNDISKIAYRIIGKAEFVDRVMNNILPSNICRYIVPNADKSIPYK